MNLYDKLRKNCKYCANCGSSQKLEVHHKIFRSQKYGLKAFIKSKKDIFKESYGYDLPDYSIDDIQNLVMLCSNCHIGKLHNGDGKLRQYFEDRITINYLQIPFKKPKETLY